MMKHSAVPADAWEVFASGGLAPFFHVVEELAQGRMAVLCVVVETRGSTPQVTGAMMSYDQAGRTVGTVGGGGCLEAEVKRRARDLVLNGGAVRCELGLDHDLSVQDGMICGGTMVAIVVAIPPSRAAEWQELKRLVERGEEAVTVLEAPDEEGPASWAIRLEADPRLVICGAGHVGLEVAWFARRAGFAIEVLDDRSDFLATPRFPEGTRTHAGPVPDTLGGLALDPTAYVVIATRGHRDDLEALAAVVRRPLRYLGMLGSRRKIAALFKELRARGVGEADLGRVLTPVGLELGAVTPAEIGLAIVAQLVAVRRGATRATTGSRAGGSQA